MKRIYLDKRVWRNSRDNWVSFEGDSKLRVTKGNIYGRCVPCITNLYQQLQEGKEEIALKEAYQCWKVVAVLEDKDECLEVLKEYKENFLGDHYVKGKFGSSLPTKPTKVLMFHIEDEGERDRILKEVQACVERVNPEAKVFYQRACTNLYYDLLGDWKDSKEVTLCKDCAPDMQEEFSSIQVDAAINDARLKASQVGYVDADKFKQTIVASCPHCGAKVGGGKFCPECGKPLAAEKFCTNCGAKMEAGAKVCGECGTKQ